MAGKVTVQDVRHVAALARLGISEERAQALTQDLNGILAHMEALARVDTAGAQAVEGVGAAGMRLRPDQGPPEVLRQPPASFAPTMRDGFLVVPRLETHETSENGA